MRRLLVPLACLALLAACDDGESIDPEADAARIEDALLELDDLPEGFEEVESDDDGDDENECNEDVLDIGPDDLDENETADTDRVQFDSEDTSVRAELTAFRDTDLPERVLEGIDDDEYVECLVEQFAEELPEGAELESIEQVDSPVDSGRAVEATIRFRQGDEELEVISQQHAVLVDRFGISLTVTTVGGPPDDDLVEAAIDAMVERLEED